MFPPPSRRACSTMLPLSVIALAIGCVRVVELPGVMRADLVRPDPPSILFPADPVRRVLFSRCDSEAFTVLAGDTAADSLLVAGDNLASMELHDCQRLFTGVEIDNGALGSAPLVGLLVPQEPLLNQIDSINGTILANIVNYDTLPSHTYSELDIVNGINCLWVKGNENSDPDGSGWVAAVFHDPAGTQCHDSIPAPNPDFIVRRYVVGQGPYPPTGRWMWDLDKRTQYIGIRCGQGWCEIGRNVPVRQGGIQHPDSIPGWGDEQVLSYAPVGDTTRPKDPSTVRPSALIGSIRRTQVLRDFARISAQNLDEYLGDAEEAAEFFNQPRVVAHVTLTGAAGPASDAYELRHGFSLTSPTAISFRTQQMKKLTFFHLFDVSNWGPQYWLASIGAAGRFQVLWRTPHLHGPSGSVRWMWHDQDENAWVECDQGCCEVGPANPW